MRFSRILASSLALAVFNGAAAGDFIFANNFDGAWISGYYVGYQASLYPIAEVDFAALTHLVVGRVVPNADGSLDETFDIDAVNGPVWAKQATAAAHAHGVKAILMLGGEGANNWGSAASPQHRATFVANLVQTANEYAFDGFDLDWEPLNAVDQPNFIALAQALRAARPSLILTVPVGWINANFASSPDPFYASIAPLFDQINMMTYSMADSENHGWSGWQSWHSSALSGETGSTPSSVASSANYYLASGVPGSRLGVGIGFYGTCWSGVTLPHQSGGSVLASDNTISYENIMTKYYSAALRKYDNAAQAPYLSSATAFGSQSPKCTFLSYEDTQSVAAKGAYTLQNKLGGSIIWTINEGHQAELPAGQRDPLLEAVRSAFRP
jgi:chitinase